MEQNWVLDESCLAPDNASNTRKMMALAVSWRQPMQEKPICDSSGKQARRVGVSHAKQPAVAT